MKILIFIITGLGTHILNSMVGKLIGYKLGYLLVFVPWFLLTYIFCKVWDKRRENKRRNELVSRANAEGLTVEEYIYKDIPEKCIEMCKYYVNNCNYAELKTYLSTCLEDGKISKESYKLLMNKYCQ